jgi:hypothetical protein
MWNTNVRFRSGEEPSVKFTCAAPPPPSHAARSTMPRHDTVTPISFSEQGSRSPYTLSHLSVDGRFLLTWGPQRGLQLLDLEQRTVVFTVPATITGVLDAVLCGAQAPAHAAASSGTTAYVASSHTNRCHVALTFEFRFTAFPNCHPQLRRPSVAVALVMHPLTVR